MPVRRKSKPKQPPRFTHLANTKTTDPIPCGRCNGPIMRAMEIGLLRTVDATPLSSVEDEVAALTAGLETFDWVTGFLYYRDRDRVRGEWTRYPVLVQHRCGGK